MSGNDNPIGDSQCGFESKDDSEYSDESSASVDLVLNVTLKTQTGVTTIFDTLVLLLRLCNAAHSPSN